MTGLTSRCPDPEAIAAFVMGNLSGEELKMMADHLRECEDCREIAAEAARFDREGASTAPVVPSTPARTKEHKRPWWPLPAAAALAGVMSLALWSIIAGGDENLLEPLIDAAPRHARYVEPRLTGGFPWAPLRVARRTTDEPLDPEQMKLVGAAGSVLEKVGKKSTVDAQHAAAMAHLLAGRPNEAADLLAKTAAAARSARIWSDLAAMRLAAALKTDDATRLGEALAAADAALRLDARFTEALFNRALILEHLGLRDQAREAWTRYLAVDGASEWANEARQHLRELGPVTEFREELQRRYALLANNGTAVRVLAARFPQEARLWGETEILGRWADAVQRGSESDAQSHLRIAAGFAEQLERNGDSMLSRMVRAVRDATSEQRLVLAAAHLAFRDAQRTFRAGAPVAAEKLFADAASAFERGGSPANLLARYFLANTAYDQGRLGEARDALTRLAAEAPREYPAHRAQVLWQLGLTHAAAGDWGDAIRRFRESVAIFERLGESRYAGAVRAILAEAYDRVGDRRVGWEHRLISLRQLGSSDPGRLPAALDGAARAASVNREWDVSLSLRSLQIALLERGGNDPLYVIALLQRARSLARLGESKAAESDLARATSAMERLRDPAVRERMDVDRMTVEALLTPSPAVALPLLTRAMEFHRVKGRRMHLPELLLLRGRVHAARKDLAAAADDFETGIRELETQRNTVSAPERGWGNFAIAEDLFDEAIGLALGRGDTTGAFLYTERSRAREERPAPVVAQASFGPKSDLAVVEYAVLPAQVAIFVVKGPAIHVVVQPAEREALAAEVAQLTESAMGHDTEEIRRRSASLYRRLVAPVAEHLEGARTLVFVPDATLSTVPFSALIDHTGRYLIERHLVIVAPSHAGFARLASAPRASPATLRLLVVTGPASRAGDSTRMDSVQLEAKAVAAAYGVAHDDAPVEVDPETFGERAADADVIHFAGHAVMPDGSAQAALVTSREDGGAGRLEAGEVARMKFTRTRVVVLAACGTARGRERPGQTSISMAHAFLSAGVPTVVATLWPIDDEPAADFFPRFHRHLARGLSAAEALRAAQLESIQRGDTPPSLWAAVQTLGS